MAPDVLTRYAVFSRVVLQIFCFDAFLFTDHQPTKAPFQKEELEFSPTTDGTRLKNQGKSGRKKSFGRDGKISATTG